MSYTLPTYKELILEYSEETATLWLSMKPKGRQCFTLTMLVEMLDVFHTIDQYGSLDPKKSNTIRYLVVQSAHPEIYNTGGDLQYFFDLVKQHDPKYMKEYGIICIDLIYWALTGGKRHITTISNVTGSALGGGFEAALACNYMIAEKQATFAFPESLFGFFPGMGGYDLLARFTGSNEAAKAFTTGKRYTAQELNQFGAVYTLAETGQGKQEVKNFIESREANQQTQWALQKIMQYNQTISYDALEYSIDLWVEAAMNLTERNLRMMKILVKRQLKKGTAKDSQLKLIKNKQSAQNTTIISNKTKVA